MAPSKTQLTSPDLHGELELAAALDQDKQTMLESERDRIFGDWLADHQGILFKVVRAYAFEHADRQDLFQEVAIQVWRSVDAYRGDSSVPTWMYRIALNAAISWTRRQDRHQRGK